MNNSSKATVAVVDFGFCQIEGLMLPDGTYAISVAQANRFLAFSASPNHATKILKTLLGKDFAPTKVQTELSTTKAYTLTIPQFSQVITELAIVKQNNVAINFLRASAEETIERRFDNAFGNKIEESERNERLALRMNRLLARKSWTDCICERYLALYGVKPSSEQYKKWTIKVNLSLFDKPHFNGNRDNMELIEQRLIEAFELMCTRKASQFPKDNPDVILEKVLVNF